MFTSPLKKKPPGPFYHPDPTARPHVTKLMGTTHFPLITTK